MTRPPIATSRLRLEPLTAEHAELLVALDADAEVMRYLTVQPRSREEVLRDWLPLIVGDVGPDGTLGYWAGRTTDGNLVGWWCVNPDPEDAAAGELGYRLLRAAWGHGYAAEGATALLGHGFGTAGLDRIWAQTMAVNSRSRRVLTTIGMRFDRAWVGDWNEPIPGWEQGEVACALTRDEWRARSR